MWGTYGGLRDHWLVQCFRENPAKFRRVAEQNRISVSMEFFKARLFAFWELWYAMLDFFADPSNSHFFKNVELTFDQPEDLCRLDARTQL